MAFRQKTGGKKKGYKAPHTLEAQEMRKQLTDLVAENLEEMILPQIEKAKNGDTVAFKALIEQIFPRLSENKNTNTKEVKYRLDDNEAKTIAHELTELQKSHARKDS